MRRGGQDTAQQRGRTTADVTVGESLIVEHPQSLQSHSLHRSVNNGQLNTFPTAVKLRVNTGVCLYRLVWRSVHSSKGKVGRGLVLEEKNEHPTFHGGCVCDGQGFGVYIFLNSL